MTDEDADTNRVYLGDSVYAEIESGMIKLTTDNGFGPSNTIFLEPEVIHSLIGYARANGFIEDKHLSKYVDDLLSSF